MRDYRKDLAHQPKVLPENGGFQQPINTVPEYQYSHSSKIPNSLIEESSTVEGYPPNQHRYVDSYHQPHPQPHESAAPLPPRSSSSYQYNAPPPQSSAPLSTERDQSSNNNQGGQPSAPGGTPSMQGHARYVEANAQASEGHTTHHYNEQQLPVSANYQPSAHCTDHWDDEDESNTPVAYPVQYYQHGHAPVLASIPVDPHVTTTPTGHPIHTSPTNHEHVNPVPNVYGAPHKLPSQQPMVQQQPSLPPAKPLQQPSIVSTLSDAKPPDGYPTAGPNRPSPEPQSSGCCCTIL